MHRRDLTKALIASTAGPALLTQQVTAQTCNSPCYPRIQAEIDAGVVPSNQSYPPYDVRRLGAVCDGVTDDTLAIRNAALVGGGWLIPPGARVRITGTITIVKAVGFYSEAPVTSTMGSGATQAFLLHDFVGTFFDLVGSSASNTIGAGVFFKRIAFVQVSATGVGASGICIRNVATSDVQLCHWLRMDDFHIETGSGADDWTGGILLDSSATSPGGAQLRDCFFSRFRIVAGAHCSYAMKLVGAQNIVIEQCQANLAHADLIITGDASRLSSSVFLTGTSWNNIVLDYAQAVYGAGNSASTVQSTINAIDCAVGCSCTGSLPTLAGTRITVYGKHASGMWTVTSNNDCKYDIGANTLQTTGPLKTGGSIDGFGYISVKDGMPSPTAASGKAFIYVDSADGNLKVKFGNGVVKVIATDP